MLAECCCWTLSIKRKPVQGLVYIFMYLFQQHGSFPIMWLSFHSYSITARWTKIRKHRKLLFLLILVTQTSLYCAILSQIINQWHTCIAESRLTGQQSRCPTAAELSRDWMWSCRLEQCECWKRARLMADVDKMTHFNCSTFTVTY